MVSQKPFKKASLWYLFLQYKLSMFLSIPEIHCLHLHLLSGCFTPSLCAHIACFEVNADLQMFSSGCTCELQNIHRRTISFWTLAVEILERVCGGKSFTSEQNATSSVYTDGTTEPKSSLSTSLLHNTLPRSVIYYGFR